MTKLTDTVVPKCPICFDETFLLDVVDLNKNCIESTGFYLPLAGLPIYYSLCNSCDFCFSPTIYSWTKEDFFKNIYNDEYAQVDPDAYENRPKQNAKFIANLCTHELLNIDHLDYGGGAGYLSELLASDGFKSHSYDPFNANEGDSHVLGKKYNLITAYEVFEHVADIEKLMTDLLALMQTESLVIFSTLLSDENINKNRRLTWWYASPRNGHISLFSRKSLSILASRYGLNFGSFSNSVHIFYKKMPEWASKIFVQNSGQ